MESNVQNATMPSSRWSQEDRGVLRCCIAYNQYGGYCVPDSSRDRPAARSVLAGEVWEPSTIEFMVGRVGRGDIVHAGTFFGDFLPALSRACADGAKVWAFEPNPENHRCASITVAVNGLQNVELMNAALGEESGLLPLQISDESGSALGGVSRLVLRPPPGDSKHFTKVQVVRLDDVVPPERPVSILQLDVEGFERQALTGAMATIQRCRPILILEDMPGADWLGRNLFRLGYQVFGSVHGNTLLMAADPGTTKEVDGLCS